MVTGQGTGTMARRDREHDCHRGPATDGISVTYPTLKDGRVPGHS